jgi:alpha-tubulin suppressor-like RCC1 family protein
LGFRNEVAMSRFGWTPFPLAHRLAPLLIPALVAVLGCGDAAEQPTAPSTDLSVRAADAQALSFRQITAGGHHTCGVALDHRAYCWGDNIFGQLGDGTRTGRLKPVLVRGGPRFLRLSAGTFHTCGVTTDDRAYCWGENADGELGNGTTDASRRPVAVSTTRRFRQVSAGLLHTCGVTTDDRALCWGENLDGQLGDGTHRDRLTPRLVSGGVAFREVTAGAFYTCGVTTDDRAYCWGTNLFGQLGDGSTSLRERLTPTPVVGKHRFRRLSAGTNHTCGLTPGGAAWCWGQNNTGQLGDDTLFEDQLRPSAVATGLRFRRISAGDAHTCAIAEDESAWCWGLNSDNTLGDGTTVDAPVPVAVAGRHSFTHLGAGLFHNCALTRDGLAWCWGGNFHGQLGDGTTTTRLRPVPVAAAE